MAVGVERWCRAGRVGPAEVEILLDDGTASSVALELCDFKAKPGDLAVAEEVLDSGQVSYLLLPAPESATLRPCTELNPHADGSVTFRAERGKAAPALHMTRADLGVVDSSEAARLQRFRAEFGLTYVGESPIALFWPEGGLEKIRARLAAIDREKAVAGLRRRARSEKVFVNPYTYVPLPSRAARRGEPNGHDSLDDRLCGWFDVTFSLISPLSMRGDAQGKGRVGRFPRRLGTPFIPGSSLKGAVRSLHETMTGSCLRVVESDYLPVYRQAAKVVGEGWTMGLVTEIGEDNRIETVRLCDDVATVSVDQLHSPKALGSWEATRTGARVWLKAEDRGDGWPAATEVRRWHEDDDDCWVILVTDAGARPGPGPNEPVYKCAAGHLSETQVGVTATAWGEYLDLVDGTDDLRVARGAGRCVTEPCDKTVEYPRGFRVGKRRSAARGFAVGDVVWVKVGARDVESIKLSQIWREKGSGPLGERIKGFTPCESSTSLCPSCQVFGSADVRGDGPGRRAWDEAAEQESYAGHVRFGDALPDGEVTIDIVELAPLGRPRLGAGQFTLENGGRLDPGDPSTNRWGASPDVSGVRQVRGRRFYWHGFTDEPIDERPARHARRGHHKTNVVGSTEVVRPGASFTARVHFDGVTSSQLGGLLAACSPGLVLETLRPPGYSDEGRIAGRLGGGKPFGFGTVETTVVGLHVATAASRYRDGDAPETNVDVAVADFLGDGGIPEEVRNEVWPALAAVLHTGQVNPDRIWYPPGDLWDEVGEPVFDKPFAFFAKSAGTSVGRNSGPMIPLPRPTDLDQSLDIVPDRQARR